MQILLFVLTAVLVGYVVYTFYSSNAGQAPDTKPDALEKPEPAKKTEPKVKKKPAAKRVDPIVAEPEPVIESSGPGETAPTHYRDPETGDTAAVPSNYRFAKKWIKEALVSEGLLDRVYKSSELDDAVSRKVKTALDKFKEIRKYHA
ncbi:MAG: hypothetical protein L0Y38_00125 [Methylococcaceae bacterium]|nr:hypothetical protein [Methylococcaceae bacterium]MCI0668025.1 hypothetical protein [Methylococcaceae bacterium]MCI0732213.1 hypothetical protein [Methylococcaceae bacterium]